MQVATNDRSRLTPVTVSFLWIIVSSNDTHHDMYDNQSIIKCKN